MARKRGGAKRIRLGKVGRRVLLLAVLVAGPVGYVWYRQQDRPTQEQVELKVLAVMDFLREWERTPIEVVRVLDFVADHVPVSRGVVVDLTSFDGSNEFFFAGAPRSSQDLRILQNLGYVVGYDEHAKNPAWVAYRLFQVENEAAPERPEGFDVDPRTSGRVSSGDYTGTGYDRGHMAPNFGIGLCYGAAAQEETFLMSNIAPQTPELNRGPWKDLEQRVARRISQRFDEVWVVTGPIYERGRNPIRFDDGVTVPSAFFKIIVDQTEEGIRALALIYPQEPSPDLSDDSCLTSIDAIEEATGLDFFAPLPDDVETSFEAIVNKRVW